jgi:iron complex outermembrane receptor protein
MSNLQSQCCRTSLVNDSFNFYNPKAGLNCYEINANNQLYVSYARANREPNRTDYETEAQDQRN